MGTRGTWGFVRKGEVRIAYNHSDSYPSALGEAVLEAARGALDPAFVAQVDALKFIDDDTPITPADVEALAPYTNTSVGSQSTDDWYCLTRSLQGDPKLTLQAGYFADAGVAWAADSLFCEWGYLPLHERTSSSVPQYYPIKLVAAWPLHALPDDLDGVENGDEEDEDLDEDVVVEVVVASLDPDPINQSLEGGVIANLPLPAAFLEGRAHWAADNAPAQRDAEAGE